MLARRQGDELVVQFISLTNCERFLPASTVRIDGICEFMMTLVRVGIRPLRRSQQRQAENVAFGVVSVFAIIEQAEAMFGV